MLGCSSEHVVFKNTVLLMLLMNLFRQDLIPERSGPSSDLHTTTERVCERFCVTARVDVYDTKRHERSRVVCPVSVWVRGGGGTLWRAHPSGWDSTKFQHQISSMSHSRWMIHLSAFAARSAVNRSKPARGDRAPLLACVSADATAAGSYLLQMKLWRERLSD